MKTINKYVGLAATLALPFYSQPASAVEANPPLVQIAILLDTSNSMDGLIEQAKSQLWKIVNEFTSARHNGQRPTLQVALYEYGNSHLSRGSGYIRQVQALTPDLDKISEDLFNLKTNGGEEYCGWVIKTAIESMAWSKSGNDFKAIFIAGNEPFTQGPVDYRNSCKAAIEKGIVVNTIHCGTPQEGINGHWQDGALLAEGKYMVIDQHRAVAYLEAPQDKEIARLGGELNKTYVAYGSAGVQSQARQAAQDVNASALAPQGSALNRAAFKASANYRNDNWDLVDATKDGNLRLETVKKEELPVEMQKMSEPQRKNYIEAKSQEREKIQKEINRLNAERTRFVAQQMKQQSQTNTLDEVMIATIREQAQRKSYRFE